jgi:lysophospholipase L1-like esterase
MLILGALVLVGLTATAIAATAGRQSPAGRAQRPASDARPLLAVVGASFSAGVGAGDRHDAWPEDVGRILHWRVRVSADPGAGYVDPGARDRGPFSRLAARLDLRRLDPDVIIVQGGHDDIGEPLPLIRDRVESLMTTMHREAPRARLAVLSVFARGTRPSSAAIATNRTILAAAHRADPAILAFDPLAAHWTFPRIRDHLHPTRAGHRLIAERLAARLREWPAAP